MTISRLNRFNIETCLNAKNSLLEDDIEILIEALKDAYAGSFGLPDGEFQNLITSLENFQDESEKFYEFLNVEFTKVTDSHLKVWPNLDRRQIGAKDRKEYSVGENIAEGRSVLVELRNENEKNIACIGFTEFPMPNSNVWDGFLDNVKTVLAAADMAIIDLRGNGGGNDYYGMEMAKIFFGVTPGHPINEQRVLNTALSKLIQANNFFNRNDEYYQMYMHKVKQLEETSDLERILEYKVESPKTELGENAFTKPIYILIDGDCKSSGESTALCFEDHPYAKFVGQNSQGCIEYGNVGILVLPSSKICIQLSTHQNIFCDGRRFEKQGIVPDVWIEFGTDAFKAVLSL